MATLYVTEYAGQLQGHVPVANNPLRQNNVTISGVSAASLAFMTDTCIIRVHTDVVCSITIGNPGIAATTASKRMAADQTEYFGVKPGNVIAVISNT